MSRRIIALWILLSLTLVVFASCGKKEDENVTYADLSKGMPDTFEASDGWTNGSMFNVFWYKENVTFEDKKMQLVIDHDQNPKQGIPYSRLAEYLDYIMY